MISTAQAQDTRQGLDQIVCILHYHTLAGLALLADLPTSLKQRTPENTQGLSLGRS
jgi:hypothetical protein